MDALADVPFDVSEKSQSFGLCSQVHNPKDRLMIDIIAETESSELLYSIAETAKVNIIYPYDYFEYLLSGGSNYMNDKDLSFLENLLLWSEQLPDH